MQKALASHPLHPLICQAPPEYIHPMYQFTKFPKFPDTTVENLPLCLLWKFGRVACYLSFTFQQKGTISSFSYHHQNRSLLITRDKSPFRSVSFHVITIWELCVQHYKRGHNCRQLWRWCPPVCTCDDHVKHLHTRPSSNFRTRNLSMSSTMWFNKWNFKEINLFSQFLSNAIFTSLLSCCICSTNNVMQDSILCSIWNLLDIVGDMHTLYTLW